MSLKAKGIVKVTLLVFVVGSVAYAISNEFRKPAQPVVAAQSAASSDAKPVEHSSQPTGEVDCVLGQLEKDFPTDPIQCFSIASNSSIVSKLSKSDLTQSPESMLSCCLCASIICSPLFNVFLCPA